MSRPPMRADKRGSSKAGSPKGARKPQRTIQSVDPAEALADRTAGLQLMSVSRETESRFDMLVEELRRWQRIKNLVGPETLAHPWTRHIADSVQLFDLKHDAKKWLDIGSGGGFPGLVLGILLAETGGHIDLIEANSRKCAFLRQAARLTGAAVTVHEARIEEKIDDFAGKVDVVTARAVAPLDQLLLWSKQLLRTGAVGLFPKGQDVEAELTKASISMRIDADLVHSRTDPSARIVIVRGLGGLNP